MAFTLITLTGGPFLRADASAAQGRLTAILSAQMRNGASVIDPTPLYGTLNAAGMLKNDSGLLAFALEANDDVGTLPAAPSASYEFSLELDGAPALPFSAIISHTVPAQTVDLATLLP